MESTSPLRLPALWAKEASSKLSVVTGLNVLHYAVTQKLWEWILRAKNVVDE